MRLHLILSNLSSTAFISKIARDLRCQGSCLSSFILTYLRQAVCQHLRCHLLLSSFVPCYIEAIAIILRITVPQEPTRLGHDEKFLNPLYVKSTSLAVLTLHTQPCRSMQSWLWSHQCCLFIANSSTQRRLRSPYCPTSTQG